MRLFIGSFLDKNLLEKVPFENIQKLFEDNLKSIKKENIHMTWAFIGNVVGAIHELSLLQEIINKKIEMFKGLVFQSNTLEYWPPKKDPRLIVLSGILNKKIDLTPLIHDIQSISKIDKKENFIPHITIARFKKDRTIKASLIPQRTLPKIENFHWQIKELSLTESILTSEGPVYKKLMNWELLV